MTKEIQIGQKWVGKNHPAYIIGEIGINHNGSLDIAKQLIDSAVNAGCDAVKFQKRTPESSRPMASWTGQRTFHSTRRSKRV